MESIFGNFHFWMFVAIAIAILSSYRHVAKFINNMTTSKIELIIKDINESKELLQTTKLNLNSKYQELEDADIYLEKAKNKATIDAERYYEEFINKLNINVNSAKKSFDKYTLSKSSNYKESINKEIFELSIKKATKEIKNKLNDEEHSKLIDKSLDEMFSIQK